MLCDIDGTSSVPALYVRHRILSILSSLGGSGVSDAGPRRRGGFLRPPDPGGPCGGGQRGPGGVPIPAVGK